MLMLSSLHHLVNSSTSMCMPASTIAKLTHTVGKLSKQAQENLELHHNAAVHADPWQSQHEPVQHLVEF